MPRKRNVLRGRCVAAQLAESGKQQAAPPHDPQQHTEKYNTDPSCGDHQLWLREWFAEVLANIDQAVQWTEPDPKSDPNGMEELSALLRSAANSDDQLLWKAFRKALEEFNKDRPPTFWSHVAIENLDELRHLIAQEVASKLAAGSRFAAREEKLNRAKRRCNRTAHRPRK